MCDATEAIHYTIPLWYKLFAWFGMLNAALFIIVIAYIYWYYVRKQGYGMERKA